MTITPLIGLKIAATTYAIARERHELRGPHYDATAALHDAATRYLAHVRKLNGEVPRKPSKRKT